MAPAKRISRNVVALALLVCSVRVTSAAAVTPLQAAEVALGDEDNAEDPLPFELSDDDYHDQENAKLNAHFPRSDQLKAVLYAVGECVDTLIFEWADGRRTGFGEGTGDHDDEFSREDIEPGDSVRWVTGAGSAISKGPLEIVLHMKSGEHIRIKSEHVYSAGESVDKFKERVPDGEVLRDLAIWNGVIVRLITSDVGSLEPRPPPAPRSPRSSSLTAEAVVIEEEVEHALAEEKELLRATVREEPMTAVLLASLAGAFTVLCVFAICVLCMCGDLRGVYGVSSGRHTPFGRARLFAGRRGLKIFAGRRNAGHQPMLASSSGEQQQAMSSLLTQTADGQSDCGHAEETGGPPSNLPAGGAEKIKLPGSMPAGFAQPQELDLEELDLNELELDDRAMDVLASKVAMALAGNQSFVGALSGAHHGACNAASVGTPDTSGPGGVAGGAPLDSKGDSKD